MRVPLLDLKREHQAIANELRDAWNVTLAGMQLLKGEHVVAFEEEIATYTGTTHAVGVASGTDALILSVLGLGIGPGDEVILQANAFTAAIEAIHHCGAQPLVIDTEPDAFGPDLEALAAAITPRTRAVIAVHLYGSPLPFEPLAALCASRNIMLIEDASHAHGASRLGRKVGAIGQVGCFSAGVVKNLGAYGDAGFVTTNDASLAHRIRLLQAHGQEKKNQHLLYGFNSRLDELQAAVLRVKLRHLDRRNARRATIAAYYRERFAGLDVKVPQEGPGETHVYHQFVIRTGHRDQLQEHLRHCSIDSGIHYPVPLHRQPAWLQRYGETPRLPNAERACREILSIPVFPDLTDAEVEHVANSVVDFLRQT